MYFLVEYSTSQIDMPKNDSEKQEVQYRRDLCSTSRQSGFTLVELITVMVIVGVLAAAALPSFFNRGSFESRGFYDQVISSLRYAQKTAIAQHRNVCVTFVAPAPSTVTLTIASLNGAASPCDTALVSPNGAPVYAITAPLSIVGSAFVGAPADFSFNALGRPSAPQVITVSGYAAPITVNAETGYVR